MRDAFRNGWSGEFRQRILLVAACFVFAFTGTTYAQAEREPSWAKSAYSGMLSDDRQQDDIELTALAPAMEAPSNAALPSDLPTPHEAKPEKDSLEDVLRRLDALEKSAKPTVKMQDDGGAKSDGPTKNEKPVIGEWQDMSTEKWNVKLGGHMQLDGINWADHSPQIPAFNYVEFRRLRLLADGVGYGVYDFRIQIDIEPESGDGTDRPVVDIKDAYLTMNELPYPLCRWRIGNFFVPFGLEQVTNDTNNLFLERSIPTQNIFTADREVGMAFYGVNDQKNFTWTFGTFIDSLSESLKERIDDNQGQRVSGRLTYCPYYDEPSNGRYAVHTGAGILYTHDQDNQVRFRTRPQIHEGPFLLDSGNLPASDYTNANLEFAAVCGPFAVQSEAYLSNVNLTGAESQWLSGAYVHCSYFLTGENRVYERYGQHAAQFGRQRTYSNFFWIPGCCGPGAWELKARWSNLNLHNVNAGEYNDLTTGFNWYWTERIRVMFDYIHPVTSGGSRPFGTTESDIVGLRFDYNF